MDIGIVGLGRMGGNMGRRFRRGGVRVVGFDPDRDVRSTLAAEGVIEPAESAIALVHALRPPRLVWLMVPAGQTTELVVQDVWPEMRRGDLLVDGGNANYKDSERRAASLATADVHFADCGVSGGIHGLDTGYTLMFGGSAEAARLIEPYARILAPGPDRGWLHCGPAGAGHFVKMIHNGIEYGMMQALAEGFALLDGKKAYGLDLAAIAQTWRHGSVVRSWLLDLTAELLASDAKLADIAPHVADSGEGRWTVNEAIEQGTSAPVLALALMSRFDSQGKSEYAHKLLAMMRKGFGGHAVAAAKRDEDAA